MKWDDKERRAIFSFGPRDCGGIERGGLTWRKQRARQQKQIGHATEADEG
jgi:hypothetical protein